MRGFGEISVTNYHVDWKKDAPLESWGLSFIWGQDEVIGRADAETPVLWPPDVKNWLIWKDPDSGKDWRWEEKGTTEDEMVGWHHWLDGHEFEQDLGVGDGQGGLVCCSPRGRKESIQLSNWTELRTVAWEAESQITLRERVLQRGSEGRSIY